MSHNDAGRLLENRFDAERRLKEIINQIERVKKCEPEQLLQALEYRYEVAMQQSEEAARLEKEIKDLRKIKKV